jgi:hypothetical protein
LWVGIIAAVRAVVCACTSSFEGVRDDNAAEKERCCGKKLTQGRGCVTLTSAFSSCATGCPLGAELSVAATALFASFAHHHYPAKCNKMHKENRSGLPLVAHCLPQQVGCG